MTEKRDSEPPDSQDADERHAADQFDEDDDRDADDRLGDDDERDDDDDERSGPASSGPTSTPPDPKPSRDPASAGDDASPKLGAEAPSEASGAGWFADHYLRADTRWLGVFRIVLGGILSVEVIRRWAYADAFYTNDGLFPNHYSLFAPMGRNVFSIYHAFSTFGEVSVAFAITLAIFLCFMLGYRTRLMHVLSAICITSLNSRNLFVENGGTVVVNLLTIWTLFLPLGTRLSIDAVRRSMRRSQEHSARDLNDRSPDAGLDVPVFRLAFLGLLLQWSVIYFFNAVHKSGRGWMDGSALHWFMYQDRIITWFGVWTRENVPFGVLKFFTYGTLVVEGALAFLLLIPIKQVWMRRLAFLLAFGLHGGIALSSRLGPFSYIMVSYFIINLGAADWALVARHFGKEKRARTVIYDADCGVCLLVCRVLKQLDPFRRLTFVENTDLDALPDGLDPKLTEGSVVAVRPDGSHEIEHLAVFEILRALPGGIFLGWWLKVPPFSALGRWMYRKVAANRLEISVWLGLGACGVTRPGEVAVVEDAPPWHASLGRVTAGIREGLTLFMILIMGSQVMVDNSWVTRRIKFKRPTWVETLVDYPRLYQGWRMFAPEPPYQDGTVVVDARTLDGRKIDPLTGKEPDFSPDTPTGWGHSQFWCDYENKIRFSGHTHNRKHLVDYLLKYHERTGNPKDRLVAFDVWWIEDKSPPPGQTKSTPLRPQKLISHGNVRDSLATPWLQGKRP